MRWIEFDKERTRKKAETEVPEKQGRFKHVDSMR